MKMLTILRQSPVRRGTRVCACALIAACALVVSSLEGHASGPGVNWQAFGQEVIKNAPASIRKGSETDKARYVAAKVAEKYQSLGVAPNTSLWGRLKARVTYGSATVGTCGDLTVAIKDTLEGAGFPADRLFSIGAQKSAVRTGIDAYQLHDMVNWNHGGVGVAIGGKIWVIDAWRFSVDHGSFGGFDKSLYNLMPLASWGRQMSADGYGSFFSEDKDVNVKNFTNVDTLEMALENTSAVSRSHQAQPTETEQPPTSGARATDKPAEPGAGVHIWPKLEGSTWAGEITAEESNAEGHATMVYQVTLRIDSANNMSGSFEFVFWHANDQPPHRHDVPCRGRYDRSTGQFLLSFEQAESQEDTTSPVKIVTVVTAKGSFSGGVELDHDDQAQGSVDGSRISTASAAGAKPVTVRTRIKGTWRFRRTN